VDRVDEEVSDLIELRGNLSRIFEEISSTRRTASGISVSPETALECTAVLACVRVLSESIASLPFNVYRRLPGGGRELMQSWLLLWGNAYAYIKGGKNGAVTELIPLHPSRMEVKRLTNGKLRYYYRESTSLIQPTPDPTEYRQDEIFHLRWLSSDGVTGYLPTTLSRDAIGLARATELHSGSFFGHGAQVGTYIETDQPHKPEVLARFKDQWNDAHQGPDKAYKTVIMPFGFHRKQVEVRNDTSQLVETRRFQLAEVARCYRVPQYLIGDLSDVRHSTVEQQAIDFVTFSLLPWCRRWEMACRRDLVVDDKQYFCQFDLNSLMAGDYAARSQFIREMANLGALDIDEIRAQIGYNPLPDGVGKKRFIQVNMQLLEAFTLENPTGQKPQTPAPQGSVDGPPEPTVGDAPDREDAPDARQIAGAEVVFKTSLRRLAAVEADGVLERRNKPEKLAAWLDQMTGRMREELRESAQATGRDIDKFVGSWMSRSRELLLECHRSGQKYESVTEDWCDKHLTSDATST
jgi:HK97 family phage portal protein